MKVTVFLSMEREATDSFVVTGVTSYRVLSSGALVIESDMGELTFAPACWAGITVVNI